jgi:hypothetical protein
MNWLAIVAAAFLVVGLGAIGRMVLRQTDEAWEQTPEYEGFRPVPGCASPSTRRPDRGAARVRQHGRPKRAPVAFAAAQAWLALRR